MRGKVAVTKNTISNTWITPAYAGKSFQPFLHLFDVWDHPRVCGEKKKMNIRKDKRMGSPPRMRGKAMFRRSFSGSSGITPAYAGKSCFMCFALSRLRDHPRVCGEKFCHLCRLCPHRGSPPRMRGKVIPVFLSVISSWITPAYAGKSHHPALSRHRIWDHPRVCGEKLL